ncbi:MAG: hypothetical protein AAFR23_03690 [Pseudomonadota bacterium]
MFSIVFVLIVCASVPIYVATGQLSALPFIGSWIAWMAFVPDAPVADMAQAASVAGNSLARDAGLLALAVLLSAMTTMIVLLVARLSSALSWRRPITLH